MANYTVSSGIIRDMNFISDLDINIRAKSAILLISTPEETRVSGEISAFAANTGRDLVGWDICVGFQPIRGTAAPQGGRDPLSALEAIEKTADDRAVLYLLKDFNDFWENPTVRRKLRTLSQTLKQTRKTILILSVTDELPEELRNDLVRLTPELPDAFEIDAEIDRMRLTPGKSLRLTSAGRERLVRAALGLTASQAQRVFAKAIARSGSLSDDDISLVAEEKKTILREVEALEYSDPAESVHDVGGLRILKEWLASRENAFGSDAAAYGLPAPKGIALIGIPGTGKSLTAKLIGRLWGMPLIRLDVGALFGSLVGESESRVRRALKIAERVSPCILWIDELEKALSQGGGDAGTSARVFGSILTWMQEKKAVVFVVATANDVEALPPELLRRGRFDEVFFLDLPTRSERREIFAVHIEKRLRLPENYDLDLLADASEGFVGSELEQAVIDAMYTGFNDNRREFTTDDILAALKRLVPLSVSQREAIQRLRGWLKDGRAQSASAPDSSDLTA